MKQAHLAKAVQAPRSVRQSLTRAQFRAGSRRTVLLAVLVVSCFVVFLTLLTISYGLEDLNFIQTYNSDEFNQIYLLQTNLQERKLDPHGFFTYGYLYNSIAFFVAQVLSWYGWHIDVRLLGMICRSLSLLFAILSFFALYKFGTVVGLPRELAAVAGLLLFTVPTFLDMSAQALTDTLQAFLLILAFGVVLRRPQPLRGLHSVPNMLRYFCCRFA
jgi:hypothetical protein